MESKEADGGQKYVIDQGTVTSVAIRRAFTREYVRDVSASHLRPLLFETISPSKYAQTIGMQIP